MFRIRLIFLCSLFVVITEAFAQEAKTSITVPLDHPSEEAAAALAHYAEALKPIKPRTDQKPLTTVTKEGFTIVTGAVFQRGNPVALISEETDTMGFAFARWQKNTWKIVNLFNLPVTFRSAGWKSSEDDYLPTTPATKPFWLQDLSGDGIPEVVVAGEVNKYYQSHYLLRYRAQPGDLVLAGDAMRTPEFRGNYVVLYDNSGRRAIYEDWHFCQWVGDELVERASWHDESPYNNIDPPFVIGTQTDAHGVEQSFRASSPQDDGEAYTITRDDKPFAKVILDWSETPLASSSFDHDSEYFFQRFTGLPRSLYPLRNEESAPIKLLKPRVKIQRGGVEAAAMFGVKLAP